jgi:iron complex outermembrane recepter protein
MFQRTKICSGLLLAFGTGTLFSLPALAQTSTDASTAPVEQQRVIVTGSMIPRTGAETAEAITVMTADSLKAMGITTVEQALQQLASNQSTVVTASMVTTWGTGGGSFASLRGLGSSRTLVLLDGQRLAGNAQVGGPVDLNSIPFAVIDRIEVLREGASSVYGADAIAGVINFITKKDLTGGQLNVTGSKAEHAGGSTYGADITYGLGNLATDGYNLMGSLSYSKQNELRALQRGFASTRGGGDNAFYSSPGSYIDSNGSLFSVDYPGCGKSTGVNSAYLTTANGYCGYQYTNATDLIPKSSVTSGMLQFSKSLDANNTLKLQYFATQSKAVTWGGAYSYELAMNPTTDATYFPTAARSTPDTVFNSTFPTTSSSTPDLAHDITLLWTDPGNNRYQGDKSTEQHFLSSLTGSHGDWDYQANLVYSQNVSTVFLGGGYPDTDMLTVTDANGDSVLNGAINPFGPQTAAGQALIDSSYQSGNLDTAVLRTAYLNASANHPVGDWFNAGASTLAVGFSLGHEQIHSATTALATLESNETGYSPSSISGKRTSEALYGELNVPVTKQLEFTASDREDHYSDFGNTNNAKVAVRYQPSKFVTFRAAASTGFRAPTLVNLYSPEILGASSTVGGASSACTSGVAPCLSQAYVLSGGNPNLKPEKSDNYDFGIVLAPTANLGVTLDLYRITISNQITSLSNATVFGNYPLFNAQGQYHLNSNNKLSVFGDGSCADVTAASCGYVLQTQQNMGGVTTNGVDVSVNYTIATATAGRFRMGMEGTWTTQYKLQAYDGSAWQSVRGNYSGGYQPVLTWQDLLTLDWSKDVWGAGLSNHYHSGYLDQNGGRSNGESIWGVHGSWKATKQVTLLVGVRNMFDTKPSFSNQTNNWQQGYNPVVSDPTGRAFYGTLTVDF